MRVFLIIMFLFIVINPSYTLPNDLELLETSIFGMTFSQETTKSRLERLEKNIYGETSKETTIARINRLKNDLVITYAEQQEKISQKSSEEMETDFEDEANYPLVDNFEKQVFNKTNQNENIYKRLENLEKEVFKKVNSSISLNERVELLAQKISPEQNKFINPHQQIPEGYEIEEFYANEQNFASENYSTDNYQNENSRIFDSRDLKKLEKKVLKQTYDSESTQTRIARLETAVFDRMFVMEDEKTRMERLNAAIEAQNTSKKYDKNRFMQFASTGWQVGAFLLMILVMIL